MKKLIIFLLVLISCKNDSKYVQDEMPTKKFSGYGIISFSKSYNGSIRYMEFYPILKSDNHDSTVEKNIKIFLTKGVIIRGNNDTKLWQDLIKSHNLEADESGFCKSLIFLKYDNSFSFNYEKPIPNSLDLKERHFKTKTFDCLQIQNCKFNIVDTKLSSHFKTR
ncbi:hypothetical protein J2X31_003129 [Flavobacterium arsenatis]|uniref:Lipoprotein n=1 Tax=Flavobacterium arsenatis TaxID=1484332 RepID=A0ABU1TT96_9FLAO|nr:hypothetical protein [Flavobacterium arsenatis]MDR6969103.1 hypothetical protein [Flavobacterium arsenatis]